MSTMQLTETMMSLLNVARESRAKAYAPYSGFAVGAAVLTNQGEFITGCNVENASSSLTNCAERVALQRAVASGHQKLIAIAVSVSEKAKTDQERMPCGACLQVMTEFLELDSFVIIDKVGQFVLADLLPKPFVFRHY